MPDGKVEFITFKEVAERVEQAKKWADLKYEKLLSGRLIDVVDLLQLGRILGGRIYREHWQEAAERLAVKTMLPDGFNPFQAWKGDAICYVTNNIELNKLHITEPISDLIDCLYVADKYLAEKRKREAEKVSNCHE